MSDNINPSHYTQGEIECIQAIRASMSIDQYRGFLKGNVMKYMWRYDRKNGVEDLKKAHWYLTELIRINETLLDVQQSKPKTL